jgi:cytochrome b
VAWPGRSGRERRDGAVTSAAEPVTLVWDWPLRLWHWAFALVVAGSLFTGLAGDITLMDWHMRLGYGALGLLLFRLGWALWGGRYARLATFRITPARLVAHFRGGGASLPRTAPGALLALGLLALVAAQAISGLYTTDDIFSAGPLVRHGSAETLALMSYLHHRTFWGILGLIGVHLLAHLAYGLRRDPTPLSMFTGRKRLAVVPTRHLLLRGVATAVAAAALVWWGLSAV